MIYSLKEIERIMGVTASSLIKGEERRLNKLKDLLLELTSSLSDQPNYTQKQILANIKDRIKEKEELIEEYKRGNYERK